MADLKLEPVVLASTQQAVGRAAAAEARVAGGEVLLGLARRGLRVKRALPEALGRRERVRYRCVAGGHRGELKAAVLAARYEGEGRPYCDECWAAQVAAHRTEPEARAHYALALLLPEAEIETNVRPDFTYRYDDRGYEFDLYAAGPGLAVEVHGPHHYDPGSHYYKGRPGEYQRVLEQDYDRAQMCREEKIAFIAVPANAPDMKRLLARALAWAEIPFARG